MNRMVPTRRRWVTAAASALFSTDAEGPRAAENNDLLSLVDALKEAEGILTLAMAGLADAERRLIKFPHYRPPIDDWEASDGEPEWYRTAVNAEAAAGDLIEAICRRIVAMPAYTRAGVAIKVRLFAAMYGDDPGRQSDADGDIETRLLRSILSDLSEG